uniref:Uncharacterized protein n=1 Tax=Steinernema glaseri TaxID=37863 RepID=A0A1I7Z3R3_9BILA
MNTVFNEGGVINGLTLNENLIKQQIITTVQCHKGSYCRSPSAKGIYRTVVRERLPKRRFSQELRSPPHDKCSRT